MIYDRKITCSFYHGETFANVKFQNKLVLGVAKAAQMDEKLGGKLLVQNILLWKEHALKCPELSNWIHYVA